MYLIHYNWKIEAVICDKLGGQKKHKAAGSVLIFETDKLSKIGRSYNLGTHIRLKFSEENNDDDSYDSSDGFSKTSPISKENDRIEITNNLGHHINISEKSLDDIVNNTEEKNETACITSLKLSEASEPSANFDSNGNIGKDQNAGVDINKTIYRLDHTDVFVCHNCKNNGDKWFMRVHDCKGLKKQNDFGNGEK